MVRVIPSASAMVPFEVRCRAFEVPDATAKARAFVKGSYEITAGRSIAVRRPTAPINV